jgi:hypothetical protein
MRITACFLRITHIARTANVRHISLNSEGGDMQSTIRFLTYAVMLAFGATIVRAQGITIDTNDVKYMFAAGKTILYHNDSLTTSASIGAPGGPAAWNFSSLVTNAVETKRSMSVASTPYAAAFPQATNVFRDSALSYSFWYAGLGATVTLKGTGYYYYSLNGDLLNLGRQGAGNGFLGNLTTPIPAQGQWIFSPAALEYKLPLQLSKSWNSDFAESISGTYSFGPFPSAFGPIVTTHSIRYTVDAYGTLTLPGSLTQEALRIRKIDIFSGSSTGARAEYIFLAKNGALVQLTVLDTSATSGTVAVTSIQWTNPTPTDVRTTAEVPAAFGLDQNYPNPFNPTTVVSYQLPVESAVRLVVYDMLGREVAVLVNEQKSAGSYTVQFNAATMASGIYLYRLTAGAYVQTRRMVLVK